MRHLPRLPNPPLYQYGFFCVCVDDDDDVVRAHNIRRRVCGELANGDVNMQTPSRSAHTRTSDRERGSGNPRFRALAAQTHATRP